MSGRNLSGFFAVCLGFAAGCASTPPQRAAPAPAPAPAEDQALKQRFERAYFAIGCLANRGVDPRMTIAPLRKPLDYLDGVVQRGGPELDATRRILDENGFASVDAFRTLGIHLRTDRSYWIGLDDRFVDELLRCK